MDLAAVEGKTMAMIEYDPYAVDSSNLMNPYNQSPTQQAIRARMTPIAMSPYQPPTWKQTLLSSIPIYGRLQQQRMRSRAGRTPTSDETESNIEKEQRGGIASALLKKLIGI